MRSRTLIANAFRWIALFSPFILHAQQNKTTSEIPQTRTASEILTRSQALSIVNDSVKKAFKIDYPIYRVYKYTDVSGQYFCVLTESTDSIATNAEGEPDTAHHTIRAIDLKLDNGKFTKVWEINDFILKNGSEISIWFWTKFCEFQDLDNDGLIAPLLFMGHIPWTNLSSPASKIQGCILAATNSPIFRPSSNPYAMAGLKCIPP